MDGRDKLVREYRLRRMLKIHGARRCFWLFCKTLAPDFYRDDRPHLKLLCDTLQKFYNRELLKEDGTPYLKLMINMPPRHGKTRTLVMFCMWILGICITNRIIACSYNDSAATDFSRYTRDGIREEKNLPHHIVYSDIFPETRISDTHATMQQWALDGQFFSYKGAGIGGSITGKGATVLISDDLVKGALESYNSHHLDSVWLWYTGTFLSRKDESDFVIPLEIMNMTRWAKGDPCGRNLAGDDAANWYVLKMEVKNRETGEMLCPSILSEQSYDDLRRTIDPAIFLANYHQEPIDILGILYTHYSLYGFGEHPKAFEQIRCYIDTADTGNDYLCAIVYGVYKGEAWILDVLYTKAGMEVTEPATAELLIRNDVKLCTIEGNAGGRGFARAVERLLVEKYKNRSVTIRTFHQGMNKQARILSWSNYVMNHVFFPANWKSRWIDFYEAITTYQKEGKNTHDDGPDSLTGVAEDVGGKSLKTTEIKSASEIGAW